MSEEAENRLRDERDVTAQNNGREVGRLRDERSAENRRELERLRGKQDEVEEKYRATVLSRLGQLDQVAIDISVIRTKCVACHEKMDEHHALLIGDAHAGSSGLVEKVRLVSERQADVRATVYGTKDAPNVGLVHKVERLDGRVSLMWKGVGLALAAAIGAVVKSVWKN